MSIKPVPEQQHSVLQEWLILEEESNARQELSPAQCLQHTPKKPPKPKSKRIQTHIPLFRKIWQSMVSFTSLLTLPVAVLLRIKLNDYWSSAATLRAGTSTQVCLPTVGPPRHRPSCPSWLPSSRCQPCPVLLGDSFLIQVSPSPEVSSTHYETRKT